VNKKRHPAFVRINETKNYADEFAGSAVMPCKGWEIVEWHPLPDAQGDPTQVHIIITPGEGPLDEFKFILRLKSKDACDGMIEALQRHRNNVWGVS
jgi:hypothetical protein